jgi:Icc-related predicted phosphoesterase
VTTIAAVGDLHCSRESRGALQDLFVRASGEADVICLCGDLTDYGLREEAEILADELASASVPIVAVLGNHDHESDQPEVIVEVLRAAGVSVLDGDAVEMGDAGFAGTKGFCGGFGSDALGAWGERALKAFAQEAVDEALKLEHGLSRLRGDRRVALLHYTPVAATAEGEPPGIYPWLGSSRLEEPIDRLGASVVVHGHAHHGALEGRTRGGVPVFNVSMPLLRRVHGSAYRLIDVPAVEVVSPSVAEAASATGDAVPIDGAGI